MAEFWKYIPTILSSLLLICLFIHSNYVTIPPFSGIPSAPTSSGKGGAHVNRSWEIKRYPLAEHMLNTFAMYEEVVSDAAWLFRSPYMIHQLLSTGRESDDEAQPFGGQLFEVPSRWTKHQFYNLKMGASNKDGKTFSPPPLWNESLIDVANANVWDLQQFVGGRLERLQERLERKAGINKHDDLDIDDEILYEDDDGVYYLTSTGRNRSAPGSGGTNITFDRDVAMLETSLAHFYGLCKTARRHLRRVREYLRRFDYQLWMLVHDESEAAAQMAWYLSLVDNFFLRSQDLMYPTPDLLSGPEKTEHVDARGYSRHQDETEKKSEVMEDVQKIQVDRHNGSTTTRNAGSNHFMAGPRPTRNAGSNHFTAENDTFPPMGEDAWEEWYNLFWKDHVESIAAPALESTSRDWDLWATNLTLRVFFREGKGQYRRFIFKDHVGDQVDINAPPLDRILFVAEQLETSLVEAGNALDMLSSQAALWAAATAVAEMELPGGRFYPPDMGHRSERGFLEILFAFVTDPLLSFSNRGKDYTSRAQVLWTQLNTTNQYLGMAYNGLLAEKSKIKVVKDRLNTTVTELERLVGLRLLDQAVALNTAGGQADTGPAHVTINITTTILQPFPGVELTGSLDALWLVATRACESLRDKWDGIEADLLDMQRNFGGIIHK